MDCACNASTTFDALSSITEFKSSRLGAGFEMTLMSNARRSVLAIAAVGIGGREPKAGRVGRDPGEGKVGKVLLELPATPRRRNDNCIVRRPLPPPCGNA